MKKLGICTINDNGNYGNRLQNYAVQQSLKKLGFDPYTLQNECWEKVEQKKILKNYIKKYFKLLLPLKTSYKRYKNFMKFNKNIKFDKKIISKENIPGNLSEKYDFFITGSDQVWNPYFGRISEIDFLTFAEKEKRISFSASFGVETIPEDMNEWYSKMLKEMKCISVREEAGKKIIYDLVNRKDIEVLVDPTMLLNKEEWLKVSKKPKKLNNQKYILNYFLGEISIDRRNQINELAKERGWRVINILDKNDPFYVSGPAEFLYLEQHAELICTDSFHSCVFAIIMTSNFIVFNREDHNISMNSRIDNLLKKFNLENRYFEGNIKGQYLNNNFDSAYIVLENERKKAYDFLENALKVKKEGEISEN